MSRVPEEDLVALFHLTQAIRLDAQALFAAPETLQVLWDQIHGPLGGNCLSPWGSVWGWCVVCKEILAKEGPSLQPRIAHNPDLEQEVALFWADPTRFQHPVQLPALEAYWAMTLWWNLHQLHPGERQLGLYVHRTMQYNRYLKPWSGIHLIQLDAWLVFRGHLREICGL